MGMNSSRGASGILIGLAVGLLPVACGRQDPAFKEQDVDHIIVSDDAIKGGPALEEGERGRDNPPKDDDTTNGESSGENPDQGGGEEEEEEEEGGEQRRPYSVTLTQTGARPVDILWVIDNSQSMQPFQDSLRSNITNFIRALDGSALDFQIGITSTDVCQDEMPDRLEDARCPEPASIFESDYHHRGDLVGRSGTRVLKSGDPELVARFRRNANLGTDGSQFEHGLFATELAVAKSLSGEQEELVRDGAFLAVIVVSDEEDDGVGLSRTNENGINYWNRGKTRFRYEAADVVRYLDAAKGRGNYSVSAIVGTRDKNGRLCSSIEGRAWEEGAEYLRAAAMTGGSAQSICTENWHEKLAKMGEDITAQIASVRLKGKPDPKTIQVSVDGELVTRWRYVSEVNAVRFDADHIPAPGAKIRIDYYGYPQKL